MGKINVAGLTTTGVAGVNYSTVQTTASKGNGEYYAVPTAGWVMVVPKAGWGVFLLADDGTTQTAVCATAAGGTYYADGTRLSIGNVSAGAAQTTTFYYIYL